jgi:hypothetical protein
MIIIIIIEEDQLLREVVSEISPRGIKDWFFVCKKIPKRSHKQCRERFIFSFLINRLLILIIRWLNHLSPDVRKLSWTDNEKRKLVVLWLMYGNQWSKIAHELPGRFKILNLY